jgi:alpha-galactosidase
MKAVGDYIHSKGLKFGIYTDRGTKTCDGRPAAQGHEAQDASTFASWGVDYLKVNGPLLPFDIQTNTVHNAIFVQEDSCNVDHDSQELAFQQYGTMRDALNKTGRQIYFSLCGWNDWYAPEGAMLGNSWRIAGDCNGWDTVYNAIRTNEPLWKFAQIGSAAFPALHAQSPLPSPQAKTRPHRRME